MQYRYSARRGIGHDHCKPMPLAVFGRIARIFTNGLSATVTWICPVCEERLGWDLDMRSADDRARIGLLRHLGADVVDGTVCPDDLDEEMADKEAQDLDHFLTIFGSAACDVARIQLDEWGV